MGNVDEEVASLRAALDRSDTLHREHMLKWAEVAAENTTLRSLLERLAPEQPINQDEQGGCVWCGWSPKVAMFTAVKRRTKGWEKAYRESSDYANDDPASHAPDCPWVEARSRIEPDDVQKRHEQL